MKWLLKFFHERRPAILHPVFVVSLVLLIWNDAYLKMAYGNFFTGKLSDFAGLIVFPIFIATLAPRSKSWIAAVTGLCFIIWKTPIVTPLIELGNSWHLVTFGRTIDYTDYVALIVLPIVHFWLLEDAACVDRSFFENVNASFHARIARSLLILISCFAICATSAPPYMAAPKGTVYVGKDFKIRKPKTQVIDRIKAMGYNMEYHPSIIDSSARYPRRQIGYYQTDNVIIYDEKAQPIDTIANVKYNLLETGNGKSTYVRIINVTLRDPTVIQRWQTLKILHRRYKELLKNSLIEEIKK